MPAALAREVVEALRPECEARGCKVTMRVSGDAQAQFQLDRAIFERVVHLLLALQVVRWPGCLLELSLDLRDAGPGLHRLALAIEATPSGNDAGRAGALAEAGGNLALILCRRYVEWMHGTLQYASGDTAPARVAIELLLSAY
jgi:hypothetical protein